MSLKTNDEEWVEIPEWGGKVKVSKLSSITEMQLRLAQIKMDIDCALTGIKYQLDYMSRIIDNLGSKLQKQQKEE